MGFEASGCRTAKGIDALALLVPKSFTARDTSASATGWFQRSSNFDCGLRWLDRSTGSLRTMEGGGVAKRSSYALSSRDPSSARVPAGTVIVKSVARGK